MVAELRERLITQGMSIELTDAARDIVAKEGADPVYGARPLRRAIQTLIEDPLSEELLQGGWAAGDIVKVRAKDGKLVFDKEKGPIPGPRRRESMARPSFRLDDAPSPSRLPGGAAGGGLAASGE